MGGGTLPPPPTTAVNHHPQPPFSPIVHPFSDLITESENMAIGYSNQTNFGPVPSQIEVQNAISDLRRVMNGFCGTNSEIMDQFGYDSSRSVMKSLGQKRLVDAYHLLQTDPLVQRLVLSISSDTRVWGAIMNNDAVQDLRGSLLLAETGERCTDYKQEPNSASATVKWIFAVMKSKTIELIEKLEALVFEALHSVLKRAASTSKHDDLLDEKVRSSLLLSIVVLVIVVVTRSMET